MTQSEHIKQLHRIWRKQNILKVREQGKKAKLKFKEKHPDLAKKQFRAHNISAKLPMKDYCELCPEDDNKGRELSRHHFDYDYPEIFLTICYECHTWTRIQDNINKTKMRLKQKKESLG